MSVIQQINELDHGTIVEVTEDRSATVYDFNIDSRQNSAPNQL